MVLATGVVGERVCDELKLILRLLTNDGALQGPATMGRVIEALCVTCLDICIRFVQYTLYPSRVVLLSKQYNPAGHQECEGQTVGGQLSS